MRAPESTRAALDTWNLAQARMQRAACPVSRVRAGGGSTGWHWLDARPLPVSQLQTGHARHAAMLTRLLSVSEPLLGHSHLDDAHLERHDA